ncbi:MAG: nucleotide-binding domain-containing protein [Thermomicrobiales bacterium]
MKLVDDFESFLRSEVNLNQSRLDTLQERVAAIEAFLDDEATFGPILLDLIPAGSWAHRTIIKPVSDNDGFDADLLLHVTEQAAWQPKEYIGKLYAAFRANGTYRELVHRKTRCMRIDYAGEFHIDLVPYFEQAGLHYITNRLEPEDTGKLEESNPEGYTAWIDERQRATSGSFIKVVRLLKYLRDFKNTFSCKSIILTTLLGEQVNEIEAMLDPDRYKDVPTTLNTLLTKLADALPPTMPAVMDPAGTGDNFTDRYKEGWNYENFRTQMKYYAERVKEAYDETDREESIAAWQAIFGDQFKPGSLAKVAAIAPRSASVPWDGEQFIDRPPFGIPIQISPHYRLKITGRCTGLDSGTIKRRQGFRQFDLSSRGYRVEKQRSLVFKITRTNVPSPYTVYWKVRNGGDEAFRLGALRGEITQDQGRNARTETTSYKGTHYVECYIVKGGVVVANDRQNVIVT